MSFILRVGPAIGDTTRIVKVNAVFFSRRQHVYDQATRLRRQGLYVELFWNLSWETPTTCTGFVTCRFHSLNANGGVVTIVFFNVSIIHHKTSLIIRRHIYWLRRRHVIYEYLCAFKWIFLQAANPNYTERGWNKLSVFCSCFISATPRHLLFLSQGKSSRVGIWTEQKQ